MPMVDPFINDDAFSLTTLTAAMNNLKYVPGRLGALGLFDEQGLTTTTAEIEERDGVLELLDIKPRNSPGTPIGASTRKVHTFSIPHIPESAGIMADEVQGIRAFGSENQAEVLETRINERLTFMRRNMDYTNESHRLQAVMGNYYDANGNTVSLFTTFGVTQQTKAMGFNASSSSSARTKATEVLEQIEDALDGIPFSGVRVLCSSSFWKLLIEDKDAKDTYLNWQMAASLRQDPRLSFDWLGFSWERYRGTSDVLIPANTAYAIPEGVPGLFLTRYAPGNYMETVNTIGLPYYAKGERMRMNKGLELEAQSNPLNICTRPRAIIKLTQS